MPYVELRQERKNHSICPSSCPVSRQHRGKGLFNSFPPWHEQRLWQTSLSSWFGFGQLTLEKVARLHKLGDGAFTAGSYTVYQRRNTRLVLCPWTTITSCLCFVNIQSCFFEVDKQNWIAYIRLAGLVEFFHWYCTWRQGCKPACFKAHGQSREEPAGRCPSIWVLNDVNLSKTSESKLDAIIRFSSAVAPSEQ